jgi:NitT/TauT family transport system substrate-binding protein
MLNPLMTKITRVIPALLFSVTTFASTWELALNWKPEPEFGGFFAAATLLKEKNIDLKIIEGSSGIPTIQMLAAKKVPLAIVSGDELVTARDRGMDLVAVFAVFQTDPHAIMVREDSPWKSLDDLLKSPDATVALQMGLPYVAHLKKKYPNIKARLVPYQGGIAPFLAQKNYAQQCYVTAEPISARQAGVKTRVFPVSTTGFDPYVAVLAVHRDTLTKNKVDLDSIIAAVRQGWELYLKQPNEIDQMMQKLNPSMSLETFAEAGKAQYRLIKPTDDFIVGSMTADRWKTLSMQLKDLGLIKKTGDPKSYYISY